MAHEWQTGLFDCFSAGLACIHGFSLCNSITYGETQYRLHHPEDPKNEGCSFWNYDCLEFTAVALFLPSACIWGFRQRRKMREQLNISGTNGSDIAVSFACHCCALVQQDMEAKKWQERVGGYGERPVEQQPVAQAPMEYGGA